MLGKLLYGQHPTQFGRFDLVDHVIFFPSPASDWHATKPRCRVDSVTGKVSQEPCNVTLAHFVVYAYGANGIAHSCDHSRV